MRLFSSVEDLRDARLRLRLPFPFIRLVLEHNLGILARGTVALALNLLFELVIREGLTQRLRVDLAETLRHYFPLLFSESALLARQRLSEVSHRTFWHDMNVVLDLGLHVGARLLAVHLVRRRRLYAADSVGCARVYHNLGRVREHEVTVVKPNGSANWLLSKLTGRLRTIRKVYSIKAVRPHQVRVKVIHRELTARQLLLELLLQLSLAPHEVYLVRAELLLGGLEPVHGAPEQLKHARVRDQVEQSQCLLLDRHASLDVFNLIGTQFPFARAQHALVEELTETLAAQTEVFCTKALVLLPESHYGRAQVLNHPLVFLLSVHRCFLKQTLLGLHQKPLLALGHLGQALHVQ